MSVTDVAPSTERKAAPRAHFVDLLRLVMSVQMIQGHVIDALLADAWRGGRGFEIWTWVRGLTAVGFMTAAGVSFHLSSLARWETYRADRAARARRVRRAAMLIAIGYLLHAPAGVLSGDPELARRAIDEAMIVDVLQCIGVTMLLLEAMCALARRASHVVIASGALAVAAIALAPLAARVECEGSALRLVCNYVSRSGGSLFPLSPWSGFVLAGVVLGAIALPDGARTSGARAGVRLVIAAAVIAVVSVVVDALIARPSDALLYSASPGFSLVRLAAVAMVAAVLAIASARVVALPRALRTIASETLFLYVSHLLALYVAGIGLARVIGPTLSLGAAIAVAVAMIALCALGALAWASAKKRRHPSRG
ncbi:heparan-alpha-glucosaminide N-acetyltransferase domain-containing protein [Sandaracinus amylolyticus]|uniref:Heparan-alpha-glucosaminide N-acetyltransferase catalytic domain-containing protein n=1 Tax=Sandaracinus amylolyticus TaxID=927083 RepID=A0A0F6W3G4_9BACT|nr:heparan-alpha-glucosaminide N-acetyltransferase domain-containing protein [Sandaracinus amylolyticus]AKF06321.1 hypothetical protein DB32_003470 [Sandaracinus amylolyticus]